MPRPTPSKKPMYLIDHWEALARNTQYAKDYAIYDRWDNNLMQSILEYINEDVYVPEEICDEILMLQEELANTKKRTKTVRAREFWREELMAPIRAETEKLVQCKKRQNNSGLLTMPDPQKIPAIIKAARLQAEALIPTVPEDQAHKRERKIRAKMEQTLPFGVFQILSGSVKQIFYKEPPSQYKNI